ncbi:ANR family transcriptional regulator [Glaesserella parasuis]
MAGKYALTDKQKEWCHNRADYCKNWQGKRERRK